MFSLVGGGGGGGGGAASKWFIIFFVKDYQFCKKKTHINLSSYPDLMVYAHDQ